MYGDLHVAYLHNATVCLTDRHPTDNSQSLLSGSQHFQMDGKTAWSWLPEFGANTHSCVCGVQTTVGHGMCASPCARRVTLVDRYMLE